MLSFLFIWKNKTLTFYKNSDIIYLYKKKEGIA